jgi:hypothetical protein
MDTNYGLVVEGYLFSDSLFYPGAFGYRFCFFFSLKRSARIKMGPTKKTMPRAVTKIKLIIVSIISFFPICG